MNNLIEISHLSKKYKNHSLFTDFNLKIATGTITTIFGESGSGKTTLLDMMGMITNFDGGSIKLFGEPIPGVSSKKALLLRRKRISYLFQDFGLLNNSTIIDNLKLGTEYPKLSKQEKLALYQKALAEVGINKKLNTNINELSGGEKQRIAIARILLKPSELILADEPTGSLDPKNRDEIMKLLLKLKDKGKTIVIVSHDATFEKISDQVVRIK